MTSPFAVGLTELQVLAEGGQSQEQNSTLKSTESTRADRANTASPSTRGPQCPGRRDRSSARTSHERSAASVDDS
jgi:hypothetical protein